MDSQQNPEPLSPAGYLRGIRLLFGKFTGTTNVNPAVETCECTCADCSGCTGMLPEPELDPPFTVFQHVKLRSVDFDA